MILCSKLIGRKIELDEFKELSGMKSPDRMTQRLIALSSDSADEDDLLDIF